MEKRGYYIPNDRFYDEQWYLVSMPYWKGLAYPLQHIILANYIRATITHFPLLKLCSIFLDARLVFSSRRTQGSLTLYTLVMTTILRGHGFRGTLAVAWLLESWMMVREEIVSQLTAFIFGTVAPTGVAYDHIDLYSGYVSLSNSEDGWIYHLQSSQCHILANTNDL